MMALTIDEQHRKLRHVSDFELVLNAGWVGIWEGTLRPICQPCRVRILYFQRRQFEEWFLSNHYVSVTVIDPLIGPDPRGMGEAVPHIYGYRRSPDRPALCLYDHRYGEWYPDEYIADTIVPWAIEWLFYCEVWLLTGDGGAVGVILSLKRIMHARQEQTATRRAAFDGSDPPPTRSTGLAKGSAFSDPFR
jgi:hypothetical protein